MPFYEDGGKGISSLYKILLTVRHNRGMPMECCFVVRAKQNITKLMDLMKLKHQKN
jgi:hypothetical protein